LLWSHILDTTSKASPYGAKLDAAVRLLSDIRDKGEKAILFVQYSEQLDQADTALKHASIAATVVTSGNVAGQQIADFCKNNNNNTVLVLNASDETAAGSNIQAANHVIFLSPLLRENQYEYDSTMAQAIGRVRRHGQKRPIHVYRICALHTIDVDILEHRELRRDALTERNAPDIAPPLSTAMDHSDGVHDQANLQRVQLVKEDGKFSLRPKSWLYEDDVGDESDEQKMERVEGRDRAGWEDFSS
jgi:superfamily II DNA/RNA helicase